MFWEKALRVFLGAALVCVLTCGGCLYLVVSSNTRPSVRTTSDARPTPIAPASTPSATDATSPDPAPEPVQAEVKERATTTATTVKKWYEGGTLHHETMLDWKHATPADRLATSADLSIVILGQERAKRHWDHLRPFAAHFNRQMNDVVSGEDGVALSDEQLRSMKVSQAAAFIGIVFRSGLEQVNWNVPLYCAVLDKEIAERDAKNAAAKSAREEAEAERARENERQEAELQRWKEQQQADLERKKLEEEQRRRENTRSWNSADGNFTITAEFAGYSNGRVRLRKEDGTEIRVELDRLSAEDQAWVNAKRTERR